MIWDHKDFNVFGIKAFEENLWYDQECILTPQLLVGVLTVNLKNILFACLIPFAIATIERVDLIVSWNFKHIVNLEKIRGFNSVNLREGYPLLEIRTPREVISDETEDI